MHATVTLDWSRTYMLHKLVQSRSMSRCHCRLVSSETINGNLVDRSISQRIQRLWCRSRDKFVPVLVLTVGRSLLSILQVSKAGGQAGRLVGE